MKNDTKKPSELNYKTMLERINELVSSDFVEEMECKEVLPNQHDFTQDDAKRMSHLFGQIYMISHCTYCESCRKIWMVKH